jgi:fatty acid desaturase
MQQHFEANPRIDWYRSPVAPETLAGLMRRSNLRGGLQTLAHLGWFFTTAGLAYWTYSSINATNWVWCVPLLILMLFVHGTMGPFMGLIAIHELQHRTVFKSRRLNEWFEKIYAFISWSDYIWYQQSHARHHLSTCHRHADGEVVLPVKFSLKRWRVWLGLLAWDPRTTWERIKLTWRHARGDIRGDWYNHVLPADEPALRARHRGWAQTLLVGHGLLAALFLISGHGFLIAVFTLGTFYCGWLGFLCGVTQHYGLQSDTPDFRLNTRTFTCSWLTGFYYWNMQYHLEHHMYPAVPFYQLPKLRQAIQHDLPVATHGLRATWQQLLAIKSNASRDPSYIFTPEFPDGAAPVD